MKYISAELIPSQGGSFICPSETCCTHIHGLQVAVAVGLQGDLLGRSVLELLVSVSVIVEVAKVMGILRFNVVFPSGVTVGNSTGSSDVTT